jgi:hypothetical protein
LYLYFIPWTTFYIGLAFVQKSEEAWFVWSSSYIGPACIKVKLTRRLSVWTPNIKFHWNLLSSFGAAMWQYMQSSHNPYITCIWHKNKKLNSKWVPGTLFLGVKRPRREADHLPPSSDKVKEWVDLYLHSPNMPSWCGVQLKHRDNFTFTLIVYYRQFRSY